MHVRNEHHTLPLDAAQPALQTVTVVGPRAVTVEHCALHSSA